MRNREPRLSAGLEYALRHASGAEWLLVAFDFDGTLSPIVSNYETATPDSEALETLYALASLPRTEVLVISGRARSDLERRLGSCPSEVALVGSHGAERLAGQADEGGGSGVDRFVEALEGIRTAYPGVRLERKPYSLAVHYRNVAEAQQESARAELIERVEPLAMATKEGKKVVEFFTLLADKGTALASFRDEMGARPGAGRPTTVFVGDDVTDEAAFEVLSADDVGVKVGPEPSAAAYRVDEQSDVAPLLRRLLRLRSEAVQG